MLKEGVLRQPGEALIVDLELGDSGRRRTLAEQRTEGLALVEADPARYTSPTTFGASVPSAVMT